MEKKEIISRWNDFESSTFHKGMVNAFKYYKGHNDIENRKRETYTYDNRNVLTKEESHLSNNKLSHPFLELLVSQKVSYGLAKKFSLDYVIDEQKDRFKEMNDILCKDYFSRNFYALLKTVGTDSRLAGRGIFYKYYDNGKLEFLRFNPLDCCLVWEDEFTQKKLSALIRHYVKIEYSKGNKQEIHYLECYDKTGITTLKRMYSEHEWKNIYDGWADPDIKAYGEIKNGNKSEAIDFNELPFIILKNGFEMKQDLEPIKNLIDDYDLISSENSNDICDIPNAIKVVKGYNEESKEEFVKNINLHNTAFIDEDGDMSALVTPLAIDQVDIHLKRVRRDIFDAGHGVDVKENNFNDLSGVALKNLYEPVDSEFNDWALFIEEALEKIIDNCIYDIKKKTGEDYSDVQYSIIFNVDMLTNEKEISEIANNYRGILSPETLASNASWSRNADTELKGIREDMEFQNKLQGELKQKQQANNLHNTKESATA